MGSIQKLRWTNVTGDAIRFRAENEKNRMADSVPIPQGHAIEEIIGRRKASQAWRMRTAMSISPNTFSTRTAYLWAISAKHGKPLAQSPESRADSFTICGALLAAT